MQLDTWFDYKLNTNIENVLQVPMISFQETEVGISTPMLCSYEAITGQIHSCTCTDNT